MSRILVLGGGQMGKEVALQLFASDNQVSVVDPFLSGITHAHRGIQWIGGEYSTVDISRYNLIVSCLPSHLGFDAAMWALSHGKNVVDLSFMKENPLLLQGLAKTKGCLFIPDAGLAPGLSNLFVGRRLAKTGNLMSVKIYVGGVSQSPFAPYGYKATWSVEDLEQEFQRTARYTRDNEIRGIDPLSLEARGTTTINNVSMEYFIADGLRTLLQLRDRIAYMDERTLRWPGHLHSVYPLIRDGKFVKEIKEKCTEGNDTVVFKVETVGVGHHQHTDTMVVHGTENLSAMAKTTAWTCAIVADMVAQGIYKDVGVCPMEKIGEENAIAFQYIVDSLGDLGVVFKSTL